MMRFTRRPTVPTPTWGFLLWRNGKGSCVDRCTLPCGPGADSSNVFARAPIEIAVNEATGWLGTPDAANYLGLSTATLYRWIDEGHLPGMGRVIRIKVSDLEAFVVSARIAPGTLSRPRRDLDDVG